MAEESGREHDEHKRVQHSEHQQSGHTDRGSEGLLPPQGGVGFSGSLLGDSRLNGRGNQPTKVAVMRKAQQTYGNRASRRALASIQRQPGQPTVEEKRLSQVPDSLKSVFNSLVTSFKTRLASAATLQAAKDVVASHGRDLWEAATKRSQSGVDPIIGPNTDDRPLYWARLQMTQELRQWKPSAFKLNDKQRTDLLHLIEQSSRGMQSVQVNFSGVQRVKRILISGFDPFGLGTNVERGNPSGAAALALDGQGISAGKVRAEIQAVIFPVRFQDFDEGMVESFFGQYLTGSNRVDMIMTISQGGDSDFRIEQFAGRRRSEGKDNLEQTKGSHKRPVLPRRLGRGSEYLETALPKKEMLEAKAKGVPIVVGTDYEVLSTKKTKGKTPPATPAPDAVSVTGSGGGFLSNEIFYRVRLMRLSSGASIPVGHLHTPLPDRKLTGADRDAERNRIISQIKEILISALPALAPVTAPAPAPVTAPAKTSPAYIH